MKIEKLFKKLEDYFINPDEEKEEKLSLSLEEKIDSITKKLKSATSKSKKIKLKKKLSILKEFRDKI